MNSIKRIVLLIISTLLFNVLLTAQVTIGSNHTPASGAILDIKEDKVASGADSKKGLLLPRVLLESKSQILPSAGSQKSLHIGLMVYNIGKPECPYLPRGVYVWNGLEWVLLNTINN